MHMNAPADRLSGADDHPPVPAAGRRRARLGPARSGGVRAGPPPRTRRSLEELGLQRARLQTTGGDAAAF